MTSPESLPVPQQPPRALEEEAHGLLPGWGVPSNPQPQERHSEPHLRYYSNEPGRAPACPQRAARGLPTLAWEGIVRTMASALDITSRTTWRQKSGVEACQAEAIVSA